MDQSLDSSVEKLGHTSEKDPLYKIRNEQVHM